MLHFHWKNGVALGLISTLSLSLWRIPNKVFLGTWQLRRFLFGWMVHLVMFLKNSPRKLEARWWFQTCFSFTRKLGKMSNLTVAYFSDGLVQPPTIGSQKISQASSSSRRFGCNKVLHRCQIHQAQRWRLICGPKKKSHPEWKETWLFRVYSGWNPTQICAGYNKPGIPDPY